MQHFFSDDGEKLYVSVSGSGSPLVLLHGWTASHNDWFPFLAEFNQHHTVYRWDARGHAGRELHTANAPTLPRMARDLHNLLEYWQLENATVIGHSMGALTTWQYLQDFGSARLGKIVLIDQSPMLVTDKDWQHGIYGDFNHERNQQFVEELRQDFAEGVLRLGAFGLNERAKEKYLENARGWEKSRQWLRGLNPDPLIACWESISASDYRAVLDKIDIPALLIYGSESNFYATDTAHYVRDNIPNAILKIYEGTDHCPHFWQRERFTQDVLDFVRD